MIATFVAGAYVRPAIQDSFGGYCGRGFGRARQIQDCVEWDQPGDQPSLMTVSLSLGGVK
jgi:hypothetical protein